jgi:hypothetical protein
MKTAHFWTITQRLMIIHVPYRCFGATYRSYLQGSRIQECWTHLCNSRSIAAINNPYWFRDKKNKKKHRDRKVFLLTGDWYCHFFVWLILWEVGSQARCCLCSVARLFITCLQCSVTFYDPIRAPTQTLLILDVLHYSLLAEWGELEELWEF